ncbi:MAG: hypothetical protein WC736_15925 [Gallionella sp.]|jgi:hypothetical protein
MASAWVKFRDSVEAILGIGASVLKPILGVIGFIPGVPAGVAAVLRVVPAFMAAFEIAMPEPGSGAAKKTAVLNSSKAFLDIVEKELTGGAKTNFDQLKPAIESIIEGTIGMVNGLAPQIIADDGPKTGINAPVDTP